MIYRFHNLRGFHCSVTVHGFLVSWLFRGFLSGEYFWEKLLFLYGFMLWIVLAILLYGWVLFGFCDLLAFHSSTTVHEFLESWWFRGFIKVWLNFGILRFW